MSSRRAKMSAAELRQLEADWQRAEHLRVFAEAFAAQTAEQEASE